MKASLKPCKSSVNAVTNAAIAIGTVSGTATATGGDSDGAAVTGHTVVAGGAWMLPKRV